MGSHQTPHKCFAHIESCTGNRALRPGRVLHAHLIISGLAPLTHFASKLIAMYSECGELPVARKLFDKIPKPNYRRWIVLIGACAKSGNYREALAVLGEMLSEGLRVNNYVIPSALKACGHLSELSIGKQLHGLVLRFSYEFDAFVVSALIDMYSRCGQVDKARMVFDCTFYEDLVALNAMVSGYVHLGLVKEAMCLVESMQRRGVRPNVVTWNTLISGFARVGDQLMVDELFRVMKSNGVEPDTISWTSIVSGLVQNFQNEEAFLTFRKMMDSGHLPSSNTITSLLPACANMANLRCGKEIHGYALIMGYAEDIYVRSALVDMYAKCGYIKQASNLFYKMPRKNTVTWNSMIFGYANHGHCNEAIDLFKRMTVEEEDKLDHLTFTAALMACSHGGLTELGRNLFITMKEKHKIIPRLEHYACMVYLLGHDGRLREAYDLINSMPIEPDRFVWGALLSACRKHSEIGLAEVAAKYLSELEPQSSGTNVLLSNMFYEIGSCINAARMKNMVKKKKLKKFSGCSWIEAG